MGKTVEELFDIDLETTCDDDLEPWSMCSHSHQGPQDAQTALSVATLIKYIDGKDMSAFRRAKKFVDKLKEVIDPSARFGSLRRCSAARRLKRGR